MKLYITEMRPKNWLKNIFAFVPIVFALELWNTEKLFNTSIAFIAFCFISSAVYVINDISDADKDAAHPVKCKRPIASGAISKPKAVVFTLLLAGIGLAGGFYADWLVCLLVGIYLVVNILYTLALKHKPIFDCFCIATGFILRVYAGGVASREPISDWLFLTIVSMALFMAFGKRHGELIRVGNSSTREVLKHYNLDFLNGIVFVCAGLSVVFYSLWAMNHGDNMIYTVPLIIFIVSKYLLLTHNSDSHGDPTTVIYSSKTLLAACGAYAVIVVALLYMG